MPASPPIVPEGDLLVLSYLYPPMAIGPAFVISTLLGQFDADSVIVYAGDARSSRHLLDPGGRAVGNVRRFSPPFWVPARDAKLSVRGRSVGLRLHTLGNIVVSLRVAAAVSAQLRRESTRALLVVYPSQHFLLAGLIASYLTRKPLFVYFMDVYVDGLSSGRRTARLIERQVSRRANAVFTMSAPHRAHFEERLRHYGVPDPAVFELPHPYVAEEQPEEIELEGDPSIVFTGEIYDAQADSVRRLILALALLEQRDPQLHLLTQTSVGDLEKLSIVPGQSVRIRAATRSQARAAQRAADILFLPLAFDTTEAVLRTASPSKMPEYLAARTPILVHAPAGSFLTSYARQQGFAEVVADPDAGALAGAIERLLTDGARCAALAERSQATLELHAAARVARTLRDAIAGSLH